MTVHHKITKGEKMEDSKEVTKRRATPVSMSLAQMKKTATELSKFIDANGLSTNIAGKQYVHVEGWQFAGAQMALHAVIKSCEPDMFDPLQKEVKYKAVAEIYSMKTGELISSGFAWCSSKEKKKASFDEYAIASMAQTRAIGKAYRNVLGWLVKMAGYESTPKDEIDTDTAEKELKELKKEVVTALDAKGITKGTDVMDFIEKTLGKRSVDNTDDAHKILNKLREDETE